jgi:hypothetical protein
MTDEGAEPSDAADIDGRVVEFLRTAERPRHLASEVSAALDLPRGRVRTRLQALADDGRVVRTDAERTARWAVPDRADEPEPEPGSEPEHAAGDGPEEDVDGDAGERAPEATEGAAPETTGEADGNGDPGADDAVEEAPTADHAGTDRTGDDDRTGDRDGTDAPATAEGPAEIPGRPPEDDPRELPGDLAGTGGQWWRGPARELALVVGLVAVLAALGRLRRR